ncbi:MAG: hemerythrin domain-containing protein [Sandaracinaceae bacterium]|nr:hemerythrin domain-containing protein [Sandaracinaceae bacterium]
MVDPPADDGGLAAYLRADHDRIDALFDAAIADPEQFDHDAFERARAGLLRHIGIEEKILLPYARRRRGGEPLALASVLRREHGAIASLLVPTPDHALVAELREILGPHNQREEQEGGLYPILEALAGDDVDELLARARAAPEVPTAKHFDGPRATRTAREALARSDASARATRTDEPSE